MATSTPIGYQYFQPKLLDKFGVGALSFFYSMCVCYLVVLVEPMRIQTTIGSAKKLASFAEEKFGVGALSISDSKGEKKKKKKKITSRFNCIPTTKMPD